MACISFESCRHTKGIKTLLLPKWEVLLSLPYQIYWCVGWGWCVCVCVGRGGTQELTKARRGHLDPLRAQL